MVDLIELAERCEKAEGPDRELDLCIMRYAENIGGAAENAKHYTASIDAALTLVPEGLQFYLSRGDYATAATVGREQEWHATAATPALALCAAALRARAAQGSDHD